MSDDAKRVAYYLGVVALMLCAVLLRLPAFAPAALWLDDQWVAVLVRDASLGDLLRLAPPVPLGFVLLQKAVGAVFGISPATLQLLPMAASILLVPVTAALALRITGNRAISFLAALFVATDPVLVTYSTRVKPFVFDALATALVAWLFVDTRRNPSPRVFLRLAVASVLSTFFSFASLISGAVLLHLGALLAARAALRSDPIPRAELWREAIVACAVFDAFAILVFGLILRTHGDAAVFAYWEKAYLPLTDFALLKNFLLSRGANVYEGIVAGLTARITAILVAVGALVLIAQRRTRSPTLGIVAVLCGLYAASALRCYPAGGGRTDLFVHPLGAVLVAAAIGSLVSFVHRSAPRAALALAVAIVVAVGVATQPAVYPIRGDREVIEHATATIAPGDAIVIYPWSSWAVALYGSWPVDLRVEPVSTNGFYAVPKRPQTLLLGETAGGQSFLDSPMVAPQQVDALLGDNEPARLHLIATATREPALRYIREAFEARGYVRTSSYVLNESSQDIFERRGSRDSRADGG